MSFYNVLAKPVIEFRSMPTLLEQRNSLLDEMDGIVNKAKAETRAFSDEESTRFDAIKSEIAKIDKTIAAEEEARSLESKKIITNQTEEEKRAAALVEEERAFVQLVKEGRAANLPAGTNGSIIPTTIASRIIDQVKNLSPLLSEATMWKVKGSLIIPSYDWQQHTTAYQGAEFNAITASAGVFGQVTLQGYVLGSLALISKSLINRADVDIVPFVVQEIAKSIANFLENELINGTTSMKGLKTLPAGQKTTSVTTLVIDPTEVVSLKMKVPQALQAGAKWLMHPLTLAYLQGLKSTTGQFLFGNTLAEDGGFTLLGKPVMLSDNMDQIGVGKFQIFYGDFSGLHVKMEQDVEVQILLEKYADQFAVGAIAWASVDSIIAEPQKIVALIGR